MYQSQDPFVLACCIELELNTVIVIGMLFIVHQPVLCGPKQCSLYRIEVITS